MAEVEQFHLLIVVFVPSLSAEKLLVEFCAASVGSGHLRLLRTV